MTQIKSVRAEVGEQLMGLFKQDLRVYAMQECNVEREVLSELL